MSAFEKPRCAGVVGAGTMGGGIAQALISIGVETTLYDISDEQLATAKSRIAASLTRAASKGKLQSDPEAIIALLNTTSDLTKLATANVVIEAVPENLDLKQSLLAQLEALAPAPALLATNTSSLPVTALASALRDPSRLVGMHFFNPPHRMKLVEVVRGELSASAALDHAVALALLLGKEPIVVNDVPGFATSRLGLALGLEAMRMVEQGVASVEAIDKGMELGYRHPMGPLRLTDLVGLDVRLAIAEALHKELGERFRPPQILRRMVRAKKLGVKSGQGFYRYDPPQATD